MFINYIKESEKYRPKKINILLVGEAPPPKGDKYFYIPRKMNLKLSIKKDSSLPATIFYHFFKKRPRTEKEYFLFLKKLKQKGVYLIDIIDKPIRVRDKNGINIKAIKIIKKGIKELRVKMSKRRINISDNKIIFLIPRNHYKKEITYQFPGSQIIRWIKYRMG